jgi:hypothetical protein
MLGPEVDCVIVGIYWPGSSYEGELGGAEGPDV